MTLGELYLANDNWDAMSTLVLVDEDWTIIEAAIEAYLADWQYGKYEVSSFKGDLVMIKGGKEE